MTWPSGYCAAGPTWLPSPDNSERNRHVLRDSRFVPHPPEFVRRYRAAGYWGTKTIGDEFRAVAAAYPGLDALITDERRLTFAELDARSDAIAGRLAQTGLRPGDPVIMQAGNTAETVESFYALIKMGAVPVCTLIPFGHHEIDAIARITGARAHLIQADLADRDLAAFAEQTRDAVPGMELILAIRAAAAGATRIDDVPDGPRSRPASGGAASGSAASGGGPDEIAILQLSGGTTGTPKAIPRLHAEYWYYGRATGQRFGFGPGDRVAHFMPIMHNAGIHMSLFGAHSAGATLVLGSRWEPQYVLDTLGREKITHLASLTTLIPSICDDPRYEQATASLKRLSLALPAVPPELFGKLSGKGTTVCQFFGMGEGFACSAPTDASAAMRGQSVGYPLSPGDEFRVLDPDTGMEMPDGAIGELCVRGPYTLRGYFNAAEHNARAFTRDGFLRTGDLVTVRHIDGQPCLRIEGRHKDVISRGGEKINAAEVEELLLRIPGVAAAALVAMPDERLGERACVFVVPGPPGCPSLAEIRELLRAAGVAKFKWPERLETIGELPVTAVGKVSKAQLRRELARRLEQPVAR
jgi:2,3-dihydroxybenzoate-AMP ligase